MKKHMRRLPARVRRNPDGCPVPMNLLPPSALVVPVSEVTLGTLASFLRDRALSKTSKNEVPRYAAAEVRRLLGAEPESTSALLLDPDAVLAAAGKGLSYADSQPSDSNVLTQVTNDKAKAALYAAAELPPNAEPPIYLAPVGDIETLYALTNQRSDRDVFASTRLPAAMNALLARGGADTWGVAILVPQEVVEEPKQEGDAPKYLYDVDRFRARLVSRDVLSARGNAAERDLLNKAQKLVSKLYPSLQGVEKSQKEKELANSCVYRVITVPREEQYMASKLAELGSRDFLPGDFVSRFIDVAIATYLIKPTLDKAMRESAGKGLTREAVKKAVHDYRHEHKLYSLGALEAFIDDGSRLSHVSEDDKVVLLDRIAQAKTMLTVPALAALAKDEEKGTPRAQVMAVTGRMPSYFLPNTFSVGPDRLGVQRSDIVVVLYAPNWEAQDSDHLSLSKNLTIPAQHIVKGKTFHEVADKVAHLRDNLEIAREVARNRVGPDAFDAWAKDNEIAPLLIGAVVLSNRTSLWPKPARGGLGRGSELYSVGGEEKNGKLVLFKNVVPPEEASNDVQVQPAELSERDVNLIFANFMPFSVSETEPGLFAFRLQREGAPALKYATLAENRRVKEIQALIERKAEEREQKARERKSAPRKNPQAAAAGGMADIGAAVAAVGEAAPKSQKGKGQAQDVDVEMQAIGQYLFDIAPAGDVYRRTPQEIKQRQTGARLTGATEVGARRGAKEGFVPVRRLNKSEVASRLGRQADGWWANLTRIVQQNNADPIAFTESNTEDARKHMLDRALELYGVDSGADTAARIAALTELRNRLVLDDTPTTLERDAYRPARMVRRGEEDEDFAESESLIAQLNPRRSPRPPRRPRAPRRGLRRNPLSSDYATKVAASFSREDQFAPEAEEEVDYTVTRRAFPDTYSTRQDLKAEAAAQRIAEHGQYVRFGRRPMLDDYTFGAAPPRAQAGLSVEEARAIHKRQVESYDRRAKSSIPASSALCAVNRRQKLRGYRPPSSLMRFGPPGFAEKKVVIWVSPESAAETRVMMYRRNTHIDCDFVASAGGMSLGQLIALALQDVLLWLAQRDTRKLDTYVYVGRVGDGQMRLAWKPGNALTYSAMLTNLGGNSETLSGYDKGDDVDRYKRAAQLSYVASVEAERQAAARGAAQEQEEAAQEVGLPPAEAAGSAQPKASGARKTTEPKQAQQPRTAEPPTVSTPDAEPEQQAVGGDGELLF